MIRGLIKAFLLVGMVAGLIILFGAYQLHQAQQQAQPEPHTITLKEFIQNGLGDNAHVELTGIFFGKPIIEKNGNPLRSVWLPLYVTKPPAQEAPRPAVILHVSQIADQAALDEFVKRRALTAVVCDRMPALSSWDLTLPAKFAKEYPTNQPVKTTLLAEPEIRFLSWTWGPEVLFDGTTRNLALAAGGVLALVGLVGLVWMGRIRAVAEPVAALTVDVKSRALADETAISSHAFNTREFASRGFKIWLFCGVLIAFCLLLMVAGLSLLRKDPDAAYTIVGVTSVLILLNALIIRSHLLYRSRGVAAIEICSSGLRWLKASDEPVQTAAWGEIKNVELNHLSPYPWRHVLTITLRSGEVLRLAAFSLTEYATFAKMVSAGHKQPSVTTGNVLPRLPSVAGYQPLSTASRSAK